MIETRESWFSGKETWQREMSIFDQKIPSKCWLSIDKVALESVNNETWNPENVGPQNRWNPNRAKGPIWKGVNSQKLR